MREEVQEMSTVKRKAIYEKRRSTNGDKLAYLY